MNNGMLGTPIGKDSKLRRLPSRRALLQKRLNSSNADISGEAPTGAYDLRLLNTVVYDPDGIIFKLNSDGSFVLATGKYRVRARGYQMNANGVAMHLRAVSDQRILVLGQNSFSAGGVDSGGCFVMGTINLTGEFEMFKDESVGLYTYYNTDYGGSWHTGIYTVGGDPGIYESLEIWKLTP